MDIKSTNMTNMAEVSVFAINDDMEAVIERCSVKSENQLRTSVRAGKLTGADEALLSALRKARYANRHNLEGYLKKQTEFPITKLKQSYQYNLNKLIDLGFVARSYLRYLEKETPRFYCLTPEAERYFARFGKRREGYTVSAVPLAHPQEILSDIIGFQLYCLFDAAHWTTMELRPFLALSSENIIPSLVRRLPDVTEYYFVLRRNKAMTQRVRRNLVSLQCDAQIAGRKERYVLVCEDMLHLEDIGKRFQELPAANAKQLYFSFDAALRDSCNGYPDIYTLSFDAEGEHHLHRVRLDTADGTATQSASARATRKPDENTADTNAKTEAV